MKSSGDEETGLSGELQPFEAWALVELMGHRKLAGWVTEETRFGAAMLRIDVPGHEGVASTQLYGPSALYCVTPISENTARRYALKSQPEPIQAWELAPIDEINQGRLQLANPISRDADIEDDQTDHDQLRGECAE